MPGMLRCMLQAAAPGMNVCAVSVCVCATHQQDEFAGSLHAECIFLLSCCVAERRVSRIEMREFGVMSECDTACIKQRCNR